MNLKNPKKSTDPRQIGLFDFAVMEVPERDTYSAQSEKSEHQPTEMIPDRGSIKKRKTDKTLRDIEPITSPLDQLSSSEYRVYSYLRDEFLHQRGDGDGQRITIAVGYAELSTKTQVSKRTLARALTRLEQKGYVVQHFPLVGSKQNTKAYEVRSANEILSTLAEEGIDHRALRGAESHIVNGNSHLKIKPNTALGQKPKRSA